MYHLHIVFNNNTNADFYYKTIDPINEILSQIKSSTSDFILDMGKDLYNNTISYININNVSIFTINEISDVVFNSILNKSKT